MKRILSIVLPLLLPLATALGAIDAAPHEQSWARAGGIIRLAMILFFAAVVTGCVGYATIPRLLARAGKVLFAVCIAVSIALMLAAIFIPGNPAAP